MKKFLRHFEEDCKDIQVVPATVTMAIAVSATVTIPVTVAVTEAATVPLPVTESVTAYLDKLNVVISPSHLHQISAVQS